MYYYYNYNTSVHSNPTLALRAKSSFYQSLNGGCGGDSSYSYSHSSSLYSIPRNPSLLLYSYLLSSRRQHSAYVRLEPSRAFLLTGGSIRRTVVGVCDGSSSSSSSRCCCCGCTKGDTLGSAFKKPPIKDGSCGAGTRSLRKDFDFSDSFERSGVGRRRRVDTECCGCNKGDNLGLDLETSSRNEELYGKKLPFLNDCEGSVVGRRRNVVVGEASGGSSRSGREFDGASVEEKEVQEDWKYEDDACSGRDSRKVTETKGFDRRGCGGGEVSRSSNSYSGIQYKSNSRKADREDTMSSFLKQQMEVERSDRTESSKSSQIGNNVERMSNSQRRFEQVRANGRKDRPSTVDSSVRVARDNRIEVDRQGFDNTESNNQYETQANISRIHARDAQRATDTRSSLDIRADNRRSDNSQRYFEKEQMKGGENRYSSVENVLQVARDNRTGVDRLELDKRKSNRQYETQTYISRLHATDNQRASSSRSSLEIGADNRRSDHSRRYFEEEEMMDQENTYASVENVVQARENRTQSDQQEFDKMKSDRQYETQTGISKVHATDTRRANDASSSLETRADGRWSDIRQSYFRDEQMKESENRSNSLEYVVEMAREKRIQLDKQEFDKMESDKQYTSRSSSSRIHASETERASSSRGSLGMRTDVPEENLSSAVNVVHGTGERWTIDSERVTNVHELERIHSERLNFQERSDTRIEDRKETSSSLLVRDKEEQRSTVSGESSQSTNTQMRFGRRLDGSSISLYQVKNDAIESASRLGKSSASYVGEFVDKLRQEISTTELSETNTGVQRETSQSVSDVTARLEEGRYTEEVGRDSSSRSGIKGPSDEMWDVRGASSQEPSKIEEPVKDSSPVEAVDSTLAPGSAETAVSRRSHRSLWNYLASIIKLGWGQSARSHHSATKSSARSSSNESSGSEAWFSGNEADENEDEAKKKGLNRSTKESVLAKTPAEQYEVGSSTSTGTLGIGSASKHASLVSGAEDEEGQQSIISGVVYTDQAAMLTSAKASTSMTEIGKNIEEFSRERLPVVSGTEGSETELRRRVRSPKQIGSTKGHAGESRLSSSTSMGTMRTASSSNGDSLVSRPEDLELSEGRKGRQGTASDVVPAEQLPSSSVGAGSPSSLEVETVQMPDSGSTELEDLSNREKIPEVGGSEGKDGELKRRKFQRNKQVMKEQFDEWEEAYVREREQRKADELFMREALLEAKKAADAWEVPVGAVLVQNGKVIARGCNLVEELRDSTAHAEMICIREASRVLRTRRLAETTLYVTLEPCAMCAGAILQARIDTVVWGAPNKLLGADGSWVRLFPSSDGGSNSLDSSNQMSGPVHPFHPKITIRRGILATECADAMHQFFQLRRKKMKKEEQSPPPSCLPVSTNPTKLFTKVQDIFHMMFCL